MCISSCVSDCGGHWGKSSNYALRMFLKGILKATQNYLGPLCPEHAEASAIYLLQLLNAGVYTDNGQQRSWKPAIRQRGYVGGQFLVEGNASEDTILRVQQLLDGVGCSYHMSLGTTISTKHRGVDEPQSHTWPLRKRFDSWEAMYEWYETHTGGDLAVTQWQNADGTLNTQTWAHLHLDDTYTLRRYGTTVHFQVRESTWPEDAEFDSAYVPLEQKLLEAIQQHPGVIRFWDDAKGKGGAVPATKRAGIPSPPVSEAKRSRQ